ERPVVGCDEASRELHGHVTDPVPPAPGQPAKEDYEYTRHGTANLFVIVEPLAGTRQVTVTERRTIPDFAAQVKYLCDELYPAAVGIRGGLDKPDTAVLGARVAADYPDAAGGRVGVGGGDVCAGRGVAVGEAVGVPLHAEARVVAEHGGVRVERTEPPMPEPPAAGRRATGHRASRVGGAPEPGHGQAALVVPRGRCPNQTGSPVPNKISAVMH